MIQYLAKRSWEEQLGDSCDVTRVTVLKGDFSHNSSNCGIIDSGYFFGPHGKTFSLQILRKKYFVGQE